ncbi:MAG: cation:proton antiporter [Treponema sp.]|nr:cation:proton antiporter [Treponema sp.]
MNFLHAIMYSHVNILLLIGLALFGGTFGGRIFQKLRIPQVVGYIVIGIVLGESCFNIIDAKTLATLSPINSFALGLIGFTMGNELRFDVFKKYGKQFMNILFYEAMGAFVCVFVLVFIGASFMFSLKMALIFALLFGPISSATAAAGTTDVLNEYKTKGLLTTTLLGIVALDDVFALFLYAITSSIAGNLIGHGNVSLAENILQPLYEIGGSIAVGIVSGFLLSKLLQRYTEEDRILDFTLGAVLFILGLAVVLKIDMIMTSMIMGTIFANKVPKKSRLVFGAVESFAPPIYILFFVFVGAKFNISQMSLPIAVFVVIFLIGRTAGKMLGANFGARISKAPLKVQKYLPMCLFSQSGVAIGLSIISSQRFPGVIGNTILIVVTTTTFIVQVIGPPFIRSAVKKADEVNKNITEQDVIKSLTAKDVMRSHPAIQENQTVENIVHIFSENDGLDFAVVDPDNRPIGCITVDSIKDALATENLLSLLVAADIMEPITYTVTPDMPVDSIYHELSSKSTNYVPVVDSQKKYIGFIETRFIDQLVSKKMLEVSMAI